MPKKTKKSGIDHNPFIIGAFIISLFSFTMMTAIAGMVLKTTQMNVETFAASRSKTFGKEFNQPTNPQEGLKQINPVACTEVYNPVCGYDGVSYPNGCYAGRQNVEIACDGACPCNENSPSLEIPVEEDIPNLAIPEPQL